MNKRLEQFLAAENITQAAFADKINVSRASVAHILSERNKPGYDFFAGLIRNYPSLNIEWLVTGKGKMYKFDDSRQVTPSLSPVQAPKNGVEYGDGTLFGNREAPDTYGNNDSGTRGEHFTAGSVGASGGNGDSGDSPADSYAGITLGQTAGSTFATIPAKDGDTHIEKTAETLEDKPKSLRSSKRAVKVIIFYDDGTYEEFRK